MKKQGAERQDFLVSEDPLPSETVGESIDGERKSNWLRDALLTLNDRELLIVNRRRLSESGATLEELGNELGISKERVRQLENRALTKLQSVLTRNHPEVKSWV